MFAHPVCHDLRKILFDVGQEEVKTSKIHWGGTYLNMEGPAFSTKAESLIYQSWGMDVIGMTNLCEARLAREAEICYATLAMVTDYDCWNEDDPDAVVSVDKIIKNLNKNVETARRIVRKAVLGIPEQRKCECASALRNAIITKRELIPEEAYKRLELIIGKYVR